MKSSQRVLTPAASACSAPGESIRQLTERRNSSCWSVESVRLDNVSLSPVRSTGGGENGPFLPYGGVLAFAAAALRRRRTVSGMGAVALDAGILAGRQPGGDGDKTEQPGGGEEELGEQHAGAVCVCR